MSHPDHDGSNSEEPQLKQTRRQLFYNIGFLLLGETVSMRTPFQSWIRKEEEQSERPPELVLDLFNIENTVNEILEQYSTKHGISIEDSLRRSKAKRGSSIENFLQGLPNGKDDNYIFMVAALEAYWRKHGAQVFDLKQSVARYLGGVNTAPERSSIAPAVTISSLDFDELGNPTLWIQVDSDVVESKIAHSNVQVVNMSFELGRIGFKYDLYDLNFPHRSDDVQPPQSSKITVTDSDGRSSSSISYSDGNGVPISALEYFILKLKFKISKIVPKPNRSRNFYAQDAYFDTRTFQNLQRLTKLVDKFHGKFFVAAAGNPSGGSLRTFPDIRQAREKIEMSGEWPQNLFMVGVYGHANGFAAPIARGADFYVDMNDLATFNMPAAASFATPIITEMVTRLVQLGVDDQHLRAELQLLCDNTGTPEAPLWVLSFKKVRQKFSGF